LPENLKFTAKLAVPRLEMAQQIANKLFVGGAFSPDGKFFWTSNHDMTLDHWQIGVGKLGSYKLKHRLYALAVDGKGRLYAQPGPADTNPPAFAKRNVGDIEVYEKLDPNGEADEMPRPTRAILVRGLVGRLIASADGRWVYFLDVHNGKLGRIDAEAGTVDRLLDDLSPDTLAFCLRPDGKKIFTCSQGGQLDIIDAASFKHERTIALNKGKPHEIAVTDKGMVFLLGQDLGPGFPSKGNAAVVDLTRDQRDKVQVMPLSCSHHGQYLQLAPEQDAVYIAGDRRVSSCPVPLRPALYQVPCRDCTVGERATPGWVQISPDGRTILHDAGAILSVGR
jgi:hypothetical protein